MKRRTLSLFAALAVVLGLAGFWLVSNSRAGTESPAYALIRTDGDVEIRDYPELTVATTPMSGGDMDGGFMKLFRFITGSNAGAEKIAMTTPVLIDPAPEGKTMSFIMPKTSVEKGVPSPTGETVRLEKITAARYAVLRFRGGRTAEQEQAALGKLTAWLESQKIPRNGTPLYAYYDPPWTPVFLRRNEVLLRIANPAD